MRKRSLSRSYALQVLYQVDIAGESPEAALEKFWAMDEYAPAADDVRQFTAELVKGVVENRAKVDEYIARYATNWELDRMAVVDRNILRIGAFELLMRSDIPPKVTINEAVDLAKKFSGAQAGKFVNGILDKIKNDKAA